MLSNFSKVLTVHISLLLNNEGISGIRENLLRDVRDEKKGVS